MQKGKLIVLDGLDASGKETQSKLLFESLQKQGKKVQRVAFPNYQSSSAALIKMYLAGEFGEDAGDVSPYAASSFYAVDRYATYKKELESFYLSGGILIADRYTTSNLIHQAGKIHEKKAKLDFIHWLEDFEYHKLGLPKPDLVLFLHVPVHISMKLMENRHNKAGGEQKDIHERNEAYLQETYQNAMNICGLCGYTKIECCTQEETLRSVEEIHQEIWGRIESIGL